MKDTIRQKIAKVIYTYCFRTKKVNEFGLQESLVELFEDERTKLINELESNPNEDGSISPNIQHWIESKQRQLRKINNDCPVCGHKGGHIKPIK